jgi:hypothetical protein
MPGLSLTLRLERTEITPRQIIDGAFHLLKDEKKWTKAFLARDKFNRETTALSEDAIAWTLIGALRRSAHTLGLPPELDWAPVLWQAYDAVEAGIPPDHVNLLSFNNNPWTTHDDILTVLVRALDRIDSDSRFLSTLQEKALARGASAEEGPPEGLDQQEVSRGTAPVHEGEKSPRKAA